MEIRLVRLFCRSSVLIDGVAAEALVSPFVMIIFLNSPKFRSRAGLLRQAPQHPPSSDGHHHGPPVRHSSNRHVGADANKRPIAYGGNRQALRPAFTWPASVPEPKTLSPQSRRCRNGHCHDIAVISRPSDDKPLTCINQSPSANLYFAGYARAQKYQLPNAHQPKKAPVQTWPPMRRAPGPAGGRRSDGQVPISRLGLQPARAAGKPAGHQGPFGGLRRRR